MQNASSQNKPTSVTIAIALMWLMTAIVTLMALVSPKIPESSRTLVIISVIIIFSLPPILITYRQNWARILFLILNILGSVVMLFQPITIWDWIGFIFSVVLCFLLFTPDANKWFRGHSENNQYQSVDRIKCPFCAEWIASEAKFCKHCQRELSQTDQIPLHQTSTFELPAKAVYDAQAAATARAERDAQVLAAAWEKIAVWEAQRAAATAQAASAAPPVAVYKPVVREPLSAEFKRRMAYTVMGGVIFVCIAIFGFYKWEQMKANPAMVHIPGRNYELGKYEVTQGEWKAVMGNNPSGFPSCGDSCPVEKVNWDDVQEFIQKLNSKTGKQYRLPTEAEWEYACYGGSQSEYCGGNDIDSVAWYGGSYMEPPTGNSGDKTHPAGQKQANGYGLYDMSGNVREWMSDCLEGGCAERVLRGGSWNGSPQYDRAAFRNWNVPAYRAINLGFRLARTLP